jgi:hypothetical protein
MDFALRHQYFWTPTYWQFILGHRSGWMDWNFQTTLNVVSGMYVSWTARYVLRGQNMSRRVLLPVERRRLCSTVPGNKNSYCSLAISVASFYGQIKRRQTCWEYVNVKGDTTRISEVSSNNTIIPKLYLFQFNRVPYLFSSGKYVPKFSLHSWIRKPSYNKKGYIYRTIFYSSV